MDAVRLGRGYRALRIRRGWRQVDLGRAVGVSDTVVSRIERGGGDRVTARVLGRMAEQLGARLSIRLDWNGEGLDRLLDADHAELVEQIVGTLRAAAWEALPEVTFAIGGERGSVDVLAWHALTRTVLIVEIKSVVPDAQAMLSALDRKVRLVGQIAASRGWRATRVARLLTIGSTRTSRRRVAALSDTFEARFPDRAAQIRRFIRDPGALDGLNGLWFLPFRTGAPARHRVRRRPARP